LVFFKFFMSILNKNKFIIGLVSALAVLFFSFSSIGAGTVSAQITGSGDCPKDTSYLNGLCLPNDPNQDSGGFTSASSLTELALIILKVFLGLAGIVAVIMIVVGGYWYITSGGNEEQSEKGKKALMQAIFGLIIVLMAFAIVTIITNTIANGVVFR